VRIFAETDPITQGYVPQVAGILWQWNNGSTEGELWVSTGTESGDWALILTTDNGDSLPTSDPHVAGKLWRNLGIVTVSAG
jgi:hypothetical protein